MGESISTGWRVDKPFQLGKTSGRRVQFIATAGEAKSVEAAYVTNPIPPYLRLHQDAGEPAAAERVDEIIGLASTLASAIGWDVAVCQLRSNGDEDSPSTVSPLTLGDPTVDSPALDQAAAESLVDALNSVCGELRRTRRALWEREAELAAAVPVTPRPDEDSHLADRLEAILQGGAQAIGADAAALYLLNDDTSELKIRACWGLPESRMVDEARPLRGAVADLEALVGNAVVLEDTSLLPHWKVPEEEFPSALCLPVSSPTAPLGTLWIYSTQQRDFTPEQTNMVEIVAGRIASDLDREVLMHEGVSGQDLRRQRDQVAATQFDRLPSIAPVLDDWEVAGWTTPKNEVLGDFFDWSVLPDGQLALAVGDAMGNGLESAMTAANLQTALKAHACYRHDARQMVSRLNETLWTSSAGDQFASIIYALIDPDTGQLQYSSAGKVGALWAAPTGVPTTPFLSNALPLGTQPEDTFRNSRETIAAGGTFVLVSEGLAPLLQPDGRRRCSLSQLLDDSVDAKAGDIAEAIRSQMLAKLSPLQRDCTVVVAKRRS